MKTRYFIFLSYKGTSYHGWQVQPNSVTVQKILDNALSTILNEQVETIGAGRTDTGVHAKFFCAHFDAINENLGSNKNLVFKINRFLPKDISVTRIQKVIPDASARFSALSRTYKYFISRYKDPFSADSSWYIHGELDLGTMNIAASGLIGKQDFTSFAKLHSDTKTNICNVIHAEWTVEEQMLVFTIKADRFLRNMVRSIVGTLVEVGQGKRGLNEFREIIDSKDRCRAGKSAPAKGLFLVDIEYPAGLFLI